jgi:hypothetical protein
MQFKQVIACRQSSRSAFPRKLGSISAVIFVERLPRGGNVLTCRDSFEVVHLEAKLKAAIAPHQLGPVGRVILH